MPEEKKPVSRKPRTGSPRSGSRSAKAKSEITERKLKRPAPSLPMYTDAMLNIAIRAAREAARIQRIAFRDRSRLEISSKSAGDFVTQIDKECEQVIIEEIKKAYPGHSILGEESGQNGTTEAEYLWVIDPLDGTTNFIHGIDQFAVSIALLQNGIPIHAVVYDTMRDELFTATKGKGARLDSRRIRVSGAYSIQNSLLATGFPFREGDDYESYMNILRTMMENTCGLRRAGSAALDLCWTACGRFDGYWEKGIKIWDIAAGALIAREAGAIVTDFQGEGEFLKKGEIIAATPKIYSEIIKVFRPDSL